MEGQIMCMEKLHILDVISSVSIGPRNAPKSLAAAALPQTALGELTALYQTRSWV